MSTGKRGREPPVGTLVKELVGAGDEEGGVSFVITDSCLVLPVHAKEVASLLARGRQGNQPGRHTLDLDRA